MDFTNIKFGKTIEYFRKERGLKLTEVANYTDLTIGYLSQIEHDKRQPSHEVVQKIARFLDIPFHVLVLEATLATNGADENEETLRAVLQPVFRHLTKKLYLTPITLEDLHENMSRIGNDRGDFAVKTYNRDN